MRFTRQNTGVGCRSLLQGLFLTQGPNSHLLCCRWILYQSATWSPRLFIYLVVIDGTEGSLVRGAVTLVTAGVGREGRGAVMEPSPSPLRDAHPDPLLTVAVTENLLLRQAIRSPVTSVEKLSLSLSKFC